MPLNLNDTVYKEDAIEIGDQRFILSMNIPMKMMISFQGLQISENDSDSIEKAMNFLKSFLSVKNKKDEVDTFVESLNFNQFMRIVQFIGEYINACMDEAKKKIVTES